MTEDDWFERAIAEDEESGRPTSGDETANPGEDASPGERTTAATGSQADASEPVDGGSPSEDDVFGGGEDDVFGGSEDDVFDGGEDAVFGGGDADVFGGGDDVFGGGTDGSTGGGGDGAFGEPPDDPFGGSADPFGDSDSPFGGGGAFGDSDGAFGGSGDFGLGDFDAGSGRDSEFDDEVVDSDLERIDLGIDGLDDMIRGGVPDSSLMAVVGSAGTGKTTFGLQFVERGLADDEKAIYVTLEESRERVIRSAEEKGWSFEDRVADGRLAVVDMDPVEMANSLSSIRSELPRLVDDFGASRLVLDSVSLLEMMYDDRATRRNEIYTFARSLKESGVTILLTSEADDDNPYASRHGIVEYLTDAVYILQYVRPTDFRETRLAVEIQKIRDAHHSREMKPYEITDEGISVYQQANIF